MFHPFPNAKHAKKVFITLIISSLLLSTQVIADAAQTSTVPTSKSTTMTSSSCEEGGECAVGDFGPGGGVVFYVLDSSVKSRWHYLEASPEDWNDGESDPQTLWCSNEKSFVKSSLTGNTPVKSVTSGLVGSGSKNTQSILATCPNGAANVSATYKGGGYSNWYLPSKDELKLMYKNRYVIGGFESGAYWSSTEVAARYAEAQNFSNGTELFTQKCCPKFVRPIRAF